ncbi:MAG: DUF1552 domain-containing protein [Polyangiaceae bacterium]|nr:DUF1552 domain-containing protein [Polyangiaceae bacterium]
MKRRQLLSGIGAGLALLAPLSRLRLSLGAGAANGNLLVFFTPNGFKRSQFGATNPGSAYSFLPSLQTLNNHRDKITVIRGLCNKSASDKSSHEDCVKILTCVSGNDLYKGYGPSIDQVVAKHFGGRPLTLAVEKFNDAPNWQTKISWVAANAFEPHVKSPSAVFDSVFSGLTTPNPTPTSTTTAPDPKYAQNKSVLDFVRDDLSTFRARLSTADQAKIDLHLDALREVEKRVAIAPGSVGPGPTPSTAVCDIAGLQARAQAQQDPNEVANLKGQGETMVDLISTSFACGLRRSATLFWQPASDGINPNQGGGNHHQVSHYEAPDSSAQWPKIDAWYAERFKYTLDSLSARGVLDDTVVVWATEISEEHNQNDFVMLVAGGKNLGVKLGQYIQYPFYGNDSGKVTTGRDSRNRSQADLWVSVQKALGIPGETFGDTQYSGGGLTELLG